MTSLKQFADYHNVALLLVHHLRKQRDDGDPYNMISGTNGIMGAADTIMVLTQDKRSDTNTTLSFISRDVENSDTILTFGKATCRWSIVGDAKAIERQRDSRRYESNLVVKTVKALLSQNPDGWTGTASQLMDAGLQITQQAIAASPRALTAELTKLDDQLYDDCIVHGRISRGTGGGKHQFRRILSADDILNSPLPEILF